MGWRFDTPAVVAQHPAFHVPWHAPSEQPYQIGDRALKRRLRRLGAAAYAKTALSALIAAPLVATAWLRGLRPPVARTARDMLGLAVSPLPDGDVPVRELVDELGVHHLLVRVPVWRSDEIERFAAFIDGFPGREVVVAIPQDRAALAHPASWKGRLRTIVAALHPRVTTFQIGHAPNRTKWGCAHPDDALRLLDGIAALRADFPRIRCVGPGAIDFDPLVWTRLLVNQRRFHLDAATAALYVDRRGSVRGRQGPFDFAGKLRLYAAVSACSPRLAPAARGRLWISEVNWPLAGVGEAAPTGGAECVDEETYARHLDDYHRVAWASGVVERVYWWQLIAAGYGLVDPRGGLRRRPGFHAYRALLHGDRALR